MEKAFVLKKENPWTKKLRCNKIGMIVVQKRIDDDKRIITLARKTNIQKDRFNGILKNRSKTIDLHRKMIDLNKLRRIKEDKKYCRLYIRKLQKRVDVDNQKIDLLRKIKIQKDRADCGLKMKLKYNYWD